MNRSTRTRLRLAKTNKNNVQLTPETVEGKKVLTFDGISVKRTDGIINTESKVTGAAA